MLDPRRPDFGSAPRTTGLIEGLLRFERHFDDLSWLTDGVASYGLRDREIFHKANACCGKLGTGRGVRGRRRSVLHFKWRNGGLSPDLA